MAWKDAEVRKLARHFIPAADEVGRLESATDLPGRFFHQIKTRHFGRRLATTQGTYVVTPGGTLLGSGNLLEPDQMKALLKKGLARWNALSDEARSRPAVGNNGEPDASRYPENGLALSVVLRKFYSSERAAEHRGSVRWNQDFAWFRKAEARLFVAPQPAKGVTHVVPSKMFYRLVRYHFTDTVRVFSDPYPLDCVETARLHSTVTGVEDGVMSVRLHGFSRTGQDNLPKYGTTRDQARLPRKPYRGYDARLLGYARFDLSTGRFTAFELVVYGTKRGGGAYAGEDPVKMGILLTLANQGPVHRVAPRHLSRYDWK